MIALIILGCTITILFLISIIVTYEDLHSYSESYNFLKDDEYIDAKYFMGQWTYKKNSRKEVIRFEDRSIKLLNNGYIHSNSPTLWFNPYAIYYFYKFNKLFKKLEAMEPRDEAPNMFRTYEEERMYERYMERRDSFFTSRTTTITTQQEEPKKPMDFKFLRKNQ